VVANTALLLHTRHLYSNHVAKGSAAAGMAGRREDEVLDGMLLYGIYLQNRLQLLSIGHVECGKGVAPVV
jgi:hypothetical protein